MEEQVGGACCMACGGPVALFQMLLAQTQRLLLHLHGQAWAVQWAPGSQPTTRTHASLQVCCLLDMATDPNLLARMYIGWRPFV